MALITLEEAKEILRVDGNDNDTIITAIIESLPSWVETQTGMSSTQQANNKVVKQLHGLMCRKLYYADQADDFKLERAINSLLKIVTLQNNGEAVYAELEINENGWYDADEYNGIDGWSVVHVDVPQGELMSLEVSENGTYECSEAYGFNCVTVDVQPELQALSVTSNGEYTAVACDGYNQVFVNVPSEAKLKALQVNENGVYEALDCDGYSQVFVNVEASEPVYTALSVTSNGTFTPSKGIDAFDEVFVNVPTDEKILIDGVFVENGTFEPQEGTDGYKSVTVSVGGSGEDWEQRYYNLVKGGEGDNVYLPPDRTDIPNYAFGYKSGLAGWLTIPENIESIGNYAFYGTGFSNVVFGSGLKSIGTNAFATCDNLTEVVLHEGLETIGNYAFNLCGNLVKLIIPDSVTSIGNYVCQNCNKMTHLDLGAGVSEIKYGQFNSSAIKTVIIRKTDAVVTMVSANSIYNYNSATSIYVPDSLVDTYKAATNWTAYAAKIKPLSEYVEA